MITNSDAQDVFAVCASLADRIVSVDCAEGRCKVEVRDCGDYVRYRYSIGCSAWDGHSFRSVSSNSPDLMDSVDFAVQVGDLTIVQAVLIKAHAVIFRDTVRLRRQF